MLRPAVVRSACAATARALPLELIGGRDTSLEGEAKGEREVPIHMQDSCTTLHCEASAMVAIVFAVTRRFEIQLKSGADPIGQVAIETDLLASLHAQAGNAFKIASVFPALFALWWAFHARVLEAMKPSSAS